MKMRKGRLGVAALAIVAVALLGCGRTQESAADPFDQMIDLMTDIAEQLTTIEDEASADAVAKRFNEEFIPRAESVMVKMTALKDSMSEAEWTALEESMEERGEELGERLGEQFMRIAGQEGLITTALEEAMEKFGEVLDDL